MTRHPSRWGRALGLGLGRIALVGASGAGVIDGAAAFAAPTYDMTIGQPGSRLRLPLGDGV